MTWTELQLLNGQESTSYEIQKPFKIPQRAPSAKDIGVGGRTRSYVVHVIHEDGHQQDLKTFVAEAEGFADPRDIWVRRGDRLTSPANFTGCFS